LNDSPKNHEIMMNPSQVKFCSLLGALAFAQASSPLLLQAQQSAPPTIASTADREIARRQEKQITAQAAIASANKALRDKDYEGAVAQFERTYDDLSESPLTHDLRETALDGYTSASMSLAEHDIAEGRYNEAENVVKKLLRPGYNPNYEPAVSLMVKLENPDYFNKTVTPKFVEKVKNVKGLFIDANGFYDTGRYDMAYRRCEQILNIDPYNIAARRMEEKINLAKSTYYKESYNNTRAWMVAELEKGWDRPVKKYGSTGGQVIDQPKIDIRGTERITNLLNSIIVPKIEFHDTTVVEAIHFLKAKSKELDPNHQGVNIVIKVDGGAVPAAVAAAAPGAAGLPEAAPAAGGAGDARITLSLTDIPLYEVLRYITYQANLKIKIDSYAVAIVPITEVTDTLMTKEYNVPPGFITNLPSSGGGVVNMSSAMPGKGGGGSDLTKGGSGIAARAKAKDVLMEQGVPFPEGASANYLASSSKLVVRNTQANLDMIDSLVEAAGSTAPPQVEIESKFVEIQQNNYKELSFAWTLGAPPIKTGPNGNIAFGGGDTSIGGTNGSLTSGLRSGGLAIGANAIDALLFPTAAGALAPAFGASGVLSGAQYSVLIQAMDQKKGIDLLSAPRVTTKSGQKAIIEVVREFIYPDTFTPPQIPTSTGSGFSPVTPTTPASFTHRNTGVTLDVQPTVGPDGSTIELDIEPQVVEFEGFINYGSPIYEVAPTLFGGGPPQSVLVTDNVINQPIFSTRHVKTTVNIWDGQTVVLGGLMREDVQKVQDKVPFLGDIPLLGRLFRSDVDQHLKRNLVVFVTAHLINPAGSALLDDQEKEEVVTPLTGPEMPAPHPLPEAPEFVK